MRVLRGLCAAAVVAAGLVVPVQQAAARPAGTEPVYDFAGAIRETVWVDVGRDGDGDGKPDRVAADIVRPAEPAAQGRKIPVIMDASPYYSSLGRGNESEFKTYDQQGRPVGFPLFYDNYFVPRGYAVVLVDLAGTNRSTGCVDVGGMSDVQSAKKVVDWLNGRATGYSAKSGGSEVTASWSDGGVGMIGKSYDGTIANGVAATGVAGLKTIVPISAISSWYDYYRSDGASFGFDPDGLARTVETRNGGQDCSAENAKLAKGATANGDYGPFWAERDYVAQAKKVLASVFVSHGVNDLNVKTINFGQWWDALAKAGVQRKIWLAQTGHVDPFDYRRADWVDTLHQWFDHYLMGIDNGIEKQPMATVERQPDQWADQSSYPAAGAEATTLRPHAGSVAGVGTLTTAVSSGMASFTDNPKLGEDEWAADPAATSAGRVLYSTGALSAPLQVSGTSSITVTATPSTSSARVSAMLVDYGPATIRNYSAGGEGIKTGTAETCWGATAPGDDACYKVTSADTANVGYTVISRGWADLANYRSLSHESPLTPGKAYSMTFRLASTDHVVPAGHALALIIGGTDGDFITGPANAPTLTVDLAKTSVRVPLVGTAPADPGATLPGTAVTSVRNDPRLDLR
ncbi:Xaa-Pro dipeptidyl-peptidase [Amycolatopsis sp. FDAARGOS 1241]|uniref:Xaa-Pro dipeptidyl-peptidase n=1 Tax=Amycolatopsis sp. FDAARGOS 1241 TaxID=2778070 RepID=UPI00194DC1C9|nr:Xaa-Pro dipeptidyl-peptidase [Amycolatopsis sp. FDAARGOS 1241]QRP48995.1 Xaa-Pro dipeptidyl-peptidase [Amycolatopsis sp. FDAARGOS 1241]